MCFLTDIVRDLNVMENNGGECAVVIDNIDYTVKAKKQYNFFRKTLKSINIKLTPSGSHEEKEKVSKSERKG